MIVIRSWSDGKMIGIPTRFHNIRRWACIDISKAHLEIDPTARSLTAPLLIGNAVSGNYNFIRPREPRRPDSSRNADISVPIGV
jgi:hypothetical protein